MLKSALRARVRARFGLGVRARDGELILGFGGQREGRTGARGVEERNSGDGELKRAELRERGGKKRLETLLTTTRSSGVAWPTRIGDGTADRRRDAELREAPTMARRRLGFERGKRRRLGEAKGVVQALFIGPVGDPPRGRRGLRESGRHTPPHAAPWSARQGSPTGPINSARPTPLASPSRSHRLANPSPKSPPPLELHSSSDSTRSRRSATSTRRPSVPESPPWGEQHRVSYIPSLASSRRRNRSPTSLRPKPPRCTPLRSS